MDVFKRLNHGMLFRYQGEMLELIPYGINGIRVRATKNTSFQERDWAILPGKETQGIITISEDGATLVNGKLTAHITKYGKIRFFNDKNELLLREYYRTGDRGNDFHDKEFFDDLVLINMRAREYKPSGRDYQITMRFHAFENERIYGMGQYQQDQLNLKGCLLDLMQYNTQASVPFMVSSRGYGLLWNNPGIGKVHFANNITRWEMDGTQQLDYWVTAGDSPAEIVENYTDLSGRPPVMPEYGLGFWQCKLRYRTQDEILAVAKEYHRRGLPLKVIIIDFFHWTNQGEWRFDEEYWPDPAGLVEELLDMGIKTMVSVWPTVDSRAETRQEMMDRDLLIRVDKGLPFTMVLHGFQGYTDMTNPESRDYIWDKCKESYFDKGIKLFWLDVAEPEYTVRDFDIYRYHLGPGNEVANAYPYLYAKAFDDGLVKAGEEERLTLIRCAWAGMQRFGALAWSGDVPSSFTYMRYQMQAGLNMGMAGISWWTADIGGFHGGYTEDPAFRELLVRWFQYGTFCPVMRLHGDRSPHHMPASNKVGGGMAGSGADNEIWSFGKDAEGILEKHILAREAMKPYIEKGMMEAHEKGTPLIKPLFYVFPEDEKAWHVEDAYLFGYDLLVAPIYIAGARERAVYLPGNDAWKNVHTGEIFPGGQEIQVKAPLEQIPLFAREGSDVYQLLDVLRS